ncbi:hypothetical protein E7V67_006340 [[Empedobacter] haloabium]|uniref:Uncharacterized protein n=1 Tax=[Empedobacter] haloabium TaxID=592317 RepID=A0ABZ1UPS8_9BURK
MSKQSSKANAPGGGGVPSDQAGGLGSAQKVIDCGIQNITDVCRELTAAGVSLRSTDGATQLDTLCRALQFRGPNGLNTYEGTAAGYLRMATRVKELRENWDIYTVREDVIAPDGLVHKGVARYILRGRREDLNKAAPAQCQTRGCT